MHSTACPSVSAMIRRPARSRQLDPDVAALDAGRIGRDSPTTGGHQALAGTDVEHPAMPGTRQPRARELAVAQRAAVVGAAVFAGVDGVAGPDENDPQALRFDELGLAGRHLVEPGHTDPGHGSLRDPL